MRGGMIEATVGASMCSKWPAGPAQTRRREEMRWAWACERGWLPFVKKGRKKRGEIEITSKRNKKWGATRGLPKWSPNLVLLSPKHAWLWSSDGIRCISASMIAPDMQCAQISFNACGAAWSRRRWVHARARNDRRGYVGEKKSN